MPTLILPPRYTPDSIALWHAATQLGWSTERLQGWRVPDGLSSGEFVLYGEPLFAAAVADPLNLVLLEPPLDWLPRVPERYRRRPVAFTTLAEIRDIGLPAFIKPADDKCFPARVYSSIQELSVMDQLPTNTPILVSEPVAWELEIRCFVLDRQVMTFSPYLRNGELAQTSTGAWPLTDQENEEGMIFAERLSQDREFQLPPAVVLDIGRIAGRGWVVLEANAAWGSGIYGCDPGAVLQVVRRACVHRDRLTPQDRGWVLERTI